MPSLVFYTVSFDSVYSKYIYLAQNSIMESIDEITLISFFVK